MPILATFVKEREGHTVTSDDSYTLMMNFKSRAHAIIQMTMAAGVDDSHAVSMAAMVNL